MAKGYPSYTITQLRQEIEEQAHAERIARALDIATTRLAWCLQKFPEIQDSYDQAFRKVSE